MQESATYLAVRVGKGSLFTLIQHPNPLFDLLLRCLLPLAEVCLLHLGCLLRLSLRR